MLIGELAAKTGMSRDTIRFYEKQGLIRISRRQRRDNNYKEYPEEVLTRLLMVKRLKRLGFTLDETGDLLAMIQEKLATCDSVEEMFNRKVALLDHRIREMTLLREQLKQSVKRCRSRSRAPSEDRNCPGLVSADPDLPAADGGSV